MRNKVLYLMVAVTTIFSPSLTQGQAITAKAFYNTDTISAVYLGIDFTLAKLINDAESNPTVIQSQQFNGINDLIVKEYTKEVEARNLKANPDQLKSTDDADLTRLSTNDIVKLVGNFDYGTHQGYGVLLIVEGMDKTKKLATIWFTLIDMGTKKVLTTERVDGKLGSGFGFRNYWASAIKNAINAVEDKNYKQWKATAN